MSPFRCRPCRNLAVLGAAVLLAGLAWCQSGDKPKKVALLVGVDSYDYRPFDDLNYAERDVEELAKVLRAAGYEVRLLLGSAAGADRATKANIDKALADALKKVTKRDLLMVALAGHGLQVPAKGEGGKDKTEPFFCPRDAKLGQPETLLSLSRVIKQLDERGGGTNLVLVDACRNDPSSDRGRGIDGNRVELLPEGTAVLFSCSKDQRAFESSKAGGGHGVFFHYVLEGLRGQAKDEDGQVTWHDLVRYVTKNVNPRAKEWFPNRAKLTPDGRLQTPHEMRNLIDVPVLADLGKAERKDLPKIDTGKEHPSDLGKVERKALDKADTVRLGGGVRMEFVLVPKGKSWLGGGNGKPGNKEVEIPYDFYLGKYLVTQEEWKTVTGANPSFFSRTGEVKHAVRYIADTDLKRFPVENVSWEDTQVFLTRLNERVKEPG